MGMYVVWVENVCVMAEDLHTKSRACSKLDYENAIVQNASKVFWISYKIAVLKWNISI